MVCGVVGVCVGRVRVSIVMNDARVVGVGIDDGDGAAAVAVAGVYGNVSDIGVADVGGGGGGDSIVGCYVRWRWLVWRLLCW